MKLNSQPAQYVKNKIDKDNSEKKKHKKRKKKTMWGNTVAINSVLKKKNYKAKFSTSSILKKIKSIKKNTKKEEYNFGKKKQKKMEKKHVRKVKS